LGLLKELLSCKHKYQYIKGSLPNFQQRDDIYKAILEIIADYQPITTKDIWYELGEDDRFKDGITLAEVNETLFQLEKQKMIIKGDNDSWKPIG
jgi:hypothetical protein